MAKRKSSDDNVFGLSFIDVFANTIGGLAFILILVILMIGLRFGHPIINTEHLPDAYSNAPYKIWLSASEGGGFYNWKIVEGELPEGLTIEDEARGLITGIPKLSDSKKHKEEYEFTLEVNTGDTASEMTDTRQFAITVFANQYGELKITTGDELPKAIKNSEYPLVFSAQGGKLPYKWQVANTNLSGISINENGEIVGEIKNNAGIYNMNVQVSDKNGDIDNKTLQVEVVEIPDVPPPPPAVEIKTDSLPDAIVGRKYKMALAAEGGRAPYKWTGNANGFEVSESGYLIGVPENTGELSVNFNVKDEEGNADSKRLNLSILPAPREKIEPLEILYSEPLPEAKVNENYSLYLSATGGTSPYNWSLNTGENIPGKISLEKDGRLQLNIAEQGEYKFAVALKDNLGLETNKNITIKINPSTPALKIDMDNVPQAVKGFQYGAKLNAVGGYAPYKWTIENEVSLPEGITLSDNELTGIPTESWQGEIALRVQDNAGNTANKTVKFEILESGEGSISHKLELMTDTLPTLLTGKNYEFCFATKGGAEPKNWDMEGELPNGISFNNGVLTGKCKSKGLYEITVQVSDPTGQSVQRSYALNTRSVVDSYWKPLAIGFLIAALLLLILTIIVLIRVKRAKRIELKIVTDSVPNARCSFPYKVYLSAIGGVPPYKWTISEGKLPDGLTLSQEGIIEGEPYKGVKLDDVKEIDFEVKVTDSIGNSAKQKL